MVVVDHRMIVALRALQILPEENPPHVARQQVRIGQPVAEGQVFPRTQWPLHITLLRFDVDDAVAEQVAALAGPPADKALGAALTVGEDAGFGRNGSVPVSLVQRQPDLQALHEQLATAVESAGGRILTPARSTTR